MIIKKKSSQFTCNHYLFCSLIMLLLTGLILESFVDIKNEGKGPYVKVHDKIDDGKWGTDSGKAKMDECGAKTKGAIISWGSPKVILKTNNLNFDIYDLEVTEIIPPQEKT